MSEDNAAVQDDTTAVADDSVVDNTDVTSGDGGDSSATDDAVVGLDTDTGGDDDGDAIALVDDDDAGDDADSGGGDDQDGDGDGTDSGAPESYADFKFPEGFNPDAEIMGEFAPLAKELNLSQAQAQKLVDLQVKSVKAATSPERIADAVMRAQDTIVRQTAVQWSKELKADGELGGANLDANLKTANRFIAQFGTPALKAALKETGMNTNPELIRAFVKAGVLISEDTLGDTVDNGGGNSEELPQNKMYPNEK